MPVWWWPAPGGVAGAAPPQLVSDERSGGDRRVRADRCGARRPARPTGRPAAGGDEQSPDDPLGEASALAGPRRGCAAAGADRTSSTVQPRGTVKRSACRCTGPGSSGRLGVQLDQAVALRSVARARRSPSSAQTGREQERAIGARYRTEPAPRMAAGRRCRIRTACHLARRPCRLTVPRRVPRRPRPRPRAAPPAPVEQAGPEQPGGQGNGARPPRTAGRAG